MGEKIIQPPFYNSGFYNTGAGGGGGYKYYEFIDEITGHSSFPRSTIGGANWSFLSGGAKSEILTRAQLDIPENTNKIKISFEKYIPSFTAGAQNISIKLNAPNILFYAFRNHVLWNTVKNKDIVFFANSTVSAFIDTPNVYNGGENYTINTSEYITLGTKSIFNTSAKSQYIIEKNKLTGFEDDIKIFEATKNNANTDLREIDLVIEDQTNGFYIKNLYIEWE